MASCCSLSEHHFTEAVAERDLGQYRRGKLNGPTRRMLRALRAHVPSADTVLDVGGGVGVLLHELIPGSGATATYVDAASAYLAAARAEARRRGYADRVRFLHGDFLDLAEGVPPAEVVVLNRVVCCYPDAERLLTAASERSLRWVAMSYPREGWPVRLGSRFANWRRRRGGDAFRTYIHAEAHLDQTLRRTGFERCARYGTPLWRVALYVRSDVA